MYSFSHRCECKPGYLGSGETGDCRDVCEGRCRNQVGGFIRLQLSTQFIFLLFQGKCLKDKFGAAYCQCAGSFTGEDCEQKSEFAYIAGGMSVHTIEIEHKVDE